VDAVVVGGDANTASGSHSVVVGGVGNTASGSESFAAGALANADQDNCVLFVYWHPGSGGGANCLGTQYQFRVQGDHGLSIDYGARIAPNGNGTRWVAISDTVPGKTIATWTNAYLADGGTWVNASDRESKTDFGAIDPLQVLAKVDAMPVTHWRYKSQTSELHLGPVAQDFYAAFGLGADDRHIATVDEAGVALAAIQGLHRLIQEKEAKIEAQHRAIADQQRAIAQLRERMAQLESLRSELDAVKQALLQLTSGEARNSVDPRTAARSRPSR
jgi:hypothetical protein